MVPGLVLHGAGHFAIGDRKTAARLLRWEGLALSAFVAGLGGLAVTGASSRTVSLFIPLTAAGGGLFAMTWLADVYGVVAGRGADGVGPLERGGMSPRTLPLVEAEVGGRYIYDRFFAYRAFAVTSFDFRAGRFRASPSAWVALDHDNTRLRLEGAYRLAGGTARAAVRGSFLDLEAAFTHHRYGTERFALTLGEVSLGGRLDLGRVAPTLSGSFVEMAVGMAAGGTTYFGVTTDATELLLFRSGWGCYFGRWPDREGEVLLYYDHRHDGYAAGLKLPGLGSGATGHFGVRARGYLSPRFGIAVEAQAGSAYVVGASLLVRHGGSS